jgi:hypothetical protein
MPRGKSKMSAGKMEIVIFGGKIGNSEKSGNTQLLQMG